ncbi:MAG: hypothetical protein WD995_10390, partial [Gemmatimonadota bacterium]
MEKYKLYGVAGLPRHSHPGYRAHLSRPVANFECEMLDIDIGTLFRSTRRRSATRTLPALKAAALLLVSVSMASAQSRQ